MVQFKREEPDREAFRDQLATIDEKGKRKWVFAKKPKGKLTKWRHLVAFILLIFFFAAPFIMIDGHPLLMLNFIDRKFVILGVQFWPQDFHLFFLAMISLFVFVILFTVTYGRVWCGWACPQTIFMEFIFRKIEYWIDGSARDQKILKEGPWTFKKAGKRTLKHGIFYAISFIISNWFLLYIIGKDEWWQIVTDDPANQLGGLTAMVIFSGVFFFVFSYFREQVCTAVCPYGRLQGVLLDRQSIVVAYDYNRGEPRGTFFKGEDRSKVDKGDCINCTQCVQVCPTGIDIRNGTQLECINCTACIDACNTMMKTVNHPEGLIRYTSEKLLSEGKTQKYNIRSIAYSGVLIILLGLTTYFILSRENIEATIMRAPGMLYQEQPGNKFSNLYNIKLVNKTYEDIPVDIKLLSHDGEIQIIGENINVKAQKLGESVFFIMLDKADVTQTKQMVTVGIFANGEQIDEIETTFIGPN